MNGYAIIRVLLVDDHAAARSGCMLFLKKAPDIAVDAESDTAKDAYRLAVTGAFDVVVLALSLPGMSGLEACARISSRAYARILVFSEHEQLIFVQRALAAGAGGYLTKRAPAVALADAVRIVAAGNRYIDPRVRAYNAANIPLQQLSRREFEVFRLLADGYDTHEVAQALFLSTKTVANNATRLRAKLGVRSAAQLTLLALHHGIIKA